MSPVHPDCWISQKLRSFFQERRKWTVPGLLLLVLGLGAFLRFDQLGAAGVGNAYYAATVKSMLASWHNFFFAAFEPGGSLSVDKPPLGFWIEALSAFFLGVNGFALALPNALAGVLSIYLVYRLVRRPCGPWAGLPGALALAVMPVAISAERNNTIDGLLVFMLLLAAWAFLRSVYTGRLRWLFLGTFLVGLAFNIKMLQAYLPLPAFYALYFVGSKNTWVKKSLHLAAATVLLLAVSFSWVIAVDLTPASERPYVDSTSNNTVMELIFGHNGIERLTSLRQSMGLDDRPNNQPGQGILPPGQLPGMFPGGQLPQPPGGPALPAGPGSNPGQPNPSNARGQTGSMDFGSAGTLRLFTEPLVGEASWLLPFVLAGLLALAVALWKQPMGEVHLSVILWAGWLLPEAVYFTYSQGLMHAYYLIMMGAPIAALAAMTVWASWQIIRKRALLGWSLVTLLAAGTLAFQAYTLAGQTSTAPWGIGMAGALLVVGIALAAASRFRVRLAPLALSFLLMALLIAPAIWSALTTWNPTPNSALPYAGPATRNAAGQGLGLPSDGQDRVLLDYLLTNTKPGSYLVAVERANDAAAYILETGRPVLTFGGFLGQYDEVSVDQLSKLVKSGRLRYVLSQGLPQHRGIAAWVQQNCSIANIAGLPGAGSSTGLDPRGGAQPASLYDCGG